MSGDDLPGGTPAPGETRLLDLEGQPVAVANVGGRLYAFDDLCTHRSCSLTEGALAGTTIVCGCHGSEFDVTTGAVLKGPARQPLATYQVEAGEAGLVIRSSTGESAAPAAVEEAEEILAQVPLFAGLQRDDLHALQAFTFERTFPAGTLIIEEGHTGNGMYVVKSGRAEAIRGLETDRPQALATYGPGEPFGELALLGDWKRTASVRAIDDVTCIGIDRWVFLAYLRRQPDVAVRMLQIVAERLVLTDQRLSG
jgi:3-phenylpropionate/trans-cinnamate dioxygenase ferredoxin component